MRGGALGGPFGGESIVAGRVRPTRATRRPPGHPRPAPASPGPCRAPAHYSITRGTRDFTRSIAASNQISPRQPDSLEARAALRSTGQPVPALRGPSPGVASGRCTRPCSSACGTASRPSKGFAPRCSEWIALWRRGPGAGQRTARQRRPRPALRGLRRSSAMPRRPRSGLAVEIKVNSATQP